MPMPVYMVAAETVLQDRRSGLLSIINVIEKMTIQLAPAATDGENQEPAGLPGNQVWMRVVCVWMGLPEDVGREFETDLQIEMPDGKQRELKGGGSFSFSADKPLRRAIFEVGGNLDPGQSGVVRIIARLRPVGETEWLTQQFAGLIEVVRVENPPA